MFFTQSQAIPLFYSWNDVQRKAESITIQAIDFNKEVFDRYLGFFDAVTDKHFTTYTEKALNFNSNVAEDAKKVIKPEGKKSKA